MWTDGRTTGERGVTGEPKKDNRNHSIQRTTCI